MLWTSNLKATFRDRTSCAEFHLWNSIQVSLSCRCWWFYPSIWGMASIISKMYMLYYLSILLSSEYSLGLKVHSSNLYQILHICFNLKIIWIWTEYSEYLPLDVWCLLLGTAGYVWLDSAASDSLQISGMMLMTMGVLRPLLCIW